MLKLLWTLTLWGPSRRTFCPVVKRFGILRCGGLEVGDPVQFPQLLFVMQRQKLSSSLSLSLSPFTLLSRHITLSHWGEAMLGNGHLVHPSAVWTHVECIHEVMLLSVRVWLCGSACTGGSLLICCLLCCTPALLPPSPPPSPCSQVWPEGSPSILTGVSKEVSVAILFYTPSLPEQRCCTKQPAACFFFCFILYPWPPHPPPPHPFICPVMLHHFIPGSNSKS